MAGLRPTAWTAQRCREADFQRFLGVEGEADAAEQVRVRCEIQSRAELDRDPAAQARWDERIRRAYLKHQQDPTTNHNQDQEM